MSPTTRAETIRVPGEMNYASIYKAIQKTGYSGYICMEYLPLAEPVSEFEEGRG